MSNNIVSSFSLYSTNFAFVCLALLMISLPSCNLINPDETAPGYIEITPFTFDPVPTIPELGPSTSTKIKDAWVYIDNEFHGVYELPVRFPVLSTGNHQLRIFPGILLNGIAGTRSPYPFYKSSEHTVTIPADGTVEINPTTYYLPDVECAYCESFEGSGFSLAPTAQSDTMMYLLAPGDTNIFEGASSGAAYLQTAYKKFEVTTTNEFLPPGAGAAVFVEVNYKINQEMNMGIFVYQPNLDPEQIPVITFRKSETWNKIYVPIGEFISSYPAATGFKLYFGAIKDPNTTISSFYIDNIKVVNISE